MLRNLLDVENCTIAFRQHWTRRESRRGTRVIPGLQRHWYLQVARHLQLIRFHLTLLDVAHMPAMNSLLNQCFETPPPAAMNILMDAQEAFEQRLFKVNPCGHEGRLHGRQSLVESAPPPLPGSSC